MCLLAPYMPSIVAPQASTRASAIDKVAKAGTTRSHSQEQNPQQALTPSEDVPLAPGPDTFPWLTYTQIPLLPCLCRGL